MEQRSSVWRFSLHFFEIHFIVSFLCVPLSFVAPAFQFFFLVFYRRFALCFDLVGTDFVKREVNSLYSPQNIRRIKQCRTNGYEIPTSVK